MNISALDENGKAVDWWFIYKVPQLAQDANSDSATGYEYAYFDANIDANGGKVQKSPNRLNEGKGALNLTLNSVFDKPGATTGWILYNDEMPASANGTDSGSCGHTKGVIAFDTASGSAFWLLHSWPKYAAPGGAGNADSHVWPNVPLHFPGHQYRQPDCRADGEQSGTAVLSPAPSIAQKRRCALCTYAAAEAESSCRCGRARLQVAWRYAVQGFGQEPGMGKGLLERLGRAATPRRHGRRNMDSRAYPARR